jgi:DNA-binding XRE family transcriptional regulator
MPGKKRITDAVEILDRRYREQVPNWDDEVLEEELRVRVGIAIVKMRKAAGLTQEQLAERAGITQSMMSQLENADYEGSALDMLWRVCKALRMELDLSCGEPGSRKKTCKVALVPGQPA